MERDTIAGTKGGCVGSPVLWPPLGVHPGSLGRQTELPAPPKIVGEPNSCAGEQEDCVSVAYLKVPFYANFKTGLEDGAKQFGLTYDLVDGNSGDVATELANLQNFIAQKKDLVLLTPSGDGIIPGIKLVNDAQIPLIEVNNKAGFGRSEANVLTYVGADDVEFGRLQGKLLDQAFGGKKAKVAYVMGIAGTSPQILRAKGWDEFRAKNPQYEEVARVNDDFDAAKALAVVQDLLSRFPKGQLDAIIMQGPEVGAAVDFALRNGRDEIKFIAGDYDQNVRQLIHDGKVFGTVDQDPIRRPTTR